MRKINRILFLILILLSILFSFYLTFYNKQRITVIKEDSAFSEKDATVHDIISQSFWDGVNSEGEPIGGSVYCYSLTYRDGLFLRDFRYNSSEKYSQKDIISLNFQDHTGANITLYRFYEWVFFLGWTSFIILNAINIIRSDKKVEDSTENIEDAVDKI